MRVATLFCAALIAAPTIAQAHPRDLVTVAVKVRMNDLDLSSPAGAKAAIGRLSRAATVACGGQATQPDLLTLSNAFQRCRAAALQRAVVEAANPAITRAYAESHTTYTTLAGR